MPNNKLQKRCLQTYAIDRRAVRNEKVTWQPVGLFTSFDLEEIIPCAAFLIKDQFQITRSVLRATRIK